MPRSLTQSAMGFISAALSVLIFHQGAAYLLREAGLVSWQPWSMTAMGPFHVPTLFNQMFWGGLWGIAFAFVWPQVEGPLMAIKGLVFALFGPLLAGRWLLVPMFKGEPLFAGFNHQIMLAQAIVILSFGAGLGLIYALLTHARARGVGSRVPGPPA